MIFYEVVVNHKGGEEFTRYYTTNEADAKKTIDIHNAKSYDAYYIERNDETYWSIVEYAYDVGDEAKKMFIGKFHTYEDARAYKNIYYDNIPFDRGWRYFIYLHTLKGEIILN